MCGSTQIARVAPYRNIHVTFAGLHRARCDACEMGFAVPMPDEAALAAYNARYFDAAHGGAATAVAAVAFHSGINRLRVAHVERFAAERGIGVGAVLEVGPGGGHFARHWIARHPGTAYHAIESDASCHPALRALGVAVHDGDSLLRIPQVDLVVLSHVLEHVADPAGFLTAMTRPLRRGGVLFVEVPCLDWQHKSEDEPHLLFFDKAPMRRLLARLDFADPQVSYHGRAIAELSRPSRLRRLREAMRYRLLSRGVVWPFGGVVAGLESVESPMDRAAVRPFDAHRERSVPAWWLRAVAVKT